MIIEVKPGRYIPAISGGVDSMVLLDLLSNLPGIELVVAHFNHGIRSDGHEDEKLVAAAAEKYGWQLETGYGKLGSLASEETARRARYEFLEMARSKYSAAAIITAHHQDDLIETAIINQLRGTGRRGLTAIADNNTILRPLLNYPKAEILKYAEHNHLRWREDPTNQNEDYLRNYVRLKLVPKMDASQRRSFLNTLSRLSKNNKEMDRQLGSISRTVQTNGKINRSKFSILPAELGNELLVYWLRREGLLEFDKKTINRLNVALRTAKADSEHPVKGDLIIKIGRQTAEFERQPLR